MSLTISVIGATGMLGEPVARRLRSEGHTVRVVSRTLNKAQKIFNGDFECAQADLDDPDSLRRVLDGCDGVHINLNGGPTPEDYDRVEHRGPVTIARIASEMGVAKLTITSGISARPENAGFPSSNAKTKAIEGIKESGVPYVVFRPHWFFESLPLFVRGKHAVLFGSMTHRWHWLAVEDYTRMVSGAYANNDARNVVLDVWGPEPISMADALARFCASSPEPLSINRLPLWRARLAALLSGNTGLKSTVAKMRFWNDFQEVGDPKLTNRLLDAPQITLDQWLTRHRSGT